MKRLLIFVMLLIPIALFPQERINAPLPVISIPITELSFAKRWMYDSSTEQWNEQNNSVVDITDGIDFVKYEFRKVEYKNKKFIAFLVYYKNVYWDYPEIYVGAHHVITLNYFLVDEDEYLNKIVEKKYDELLISNQPITLNLKKFNTLELVIKRRVILYTINRVLGTASGIEKINIDDIIKLCDNNIGNKYLSPVKNIKILVKKGKIFFIPNSEVP